MLAMHPTVQDRVHEELQLLDDTQSLTYDDVAGKLPYLEMVIKETMRLFPVAGILAREATADIQMSDCTLPKGTVCLLPMLKWLRSRKWWGDTADIFDPERFTVERSDEWDSFYYIPFSEGARNCIGQRHAMISMKIFMCHLVRRYEFSTDMKYDELKFGFEPFFKLLNKYAVKIEKR